ncbi:MAG: polysaccharide pyruvyl transferase family protein [Lachnospiraceae bacterium]
MGDKLNRLIMKRVFGYEIVRCTPLTCELSGIGSGLGHFMLSDKKYIAMAEKCTGILFPETYIWSTGFIENKKKLSGLYREKITFQAVRGELSKAIVQQLTGKKLDIPTGDGGLLASLTVDKTIRKKYNVGIIPHYKEQEHPAFRKLCDQFSGSVCIDVKKEPLDVITEIGQCECIISSSLHGLIIADSMGIPNIHIHVTDTLLGDGFKFDDYYSAFGLKHKFIDWECEKITSLYQVYDRYEISSDAVDQKKKELIKVFPFAEG